MLYKRFEEVPAWCAAVELVVRVYAFTGTGGLSRYAGMKDQIERAALSISNNIAEGFERGTTAELLTFLYIARGSAGEVRSMLSVVERLPGASPDREALGQLKADAEGISRQLGRWIESAKNSGSKGARYANDRTRHATHEARRADVFLAKLQQIREEAATSDVDHPPQATGEP